MAYNNDGASGEKAGRKGPLQTVWARYQGLSKNGKAFILVMLFVVWCLTATALSK